MGIRLILNVNLDRHTFKRGDFSSLKSVLIYRNSYCLATHHRDSGHAHPRHSGHFRELVLIEQHRHDLEDQDGLVRHHSHFCEVGFREVVAVAHRAHRRKAEVKRIDPRFETERRGVGFVYDQINNAIDDCGRQESNNLERHLSSTEKIIRNLPCGVRPSRDFYAAES